MGPTIPLQDAPAMRKEAKILRDETSQVQRLKLLRICNNFEFKDFKLIIIIVIVLGT